MKTALRILVLLAALIGVAPAGSYAQGQCLLATDPAGDPAGLRNAFGRIPGDEPGAIDILTLSMGVESGSLVSEIVVADLAAPPGALAERTGWVVAWRFGNDGDFYFVEADRRPEGVEFRARRVHRDMDEPFDATGSFDLETNTVRLEVSVSDIVGAEPGDEITDVHSWAQDRSGALDQALPEANLPMSHDDAPDSTARWAIFPLTGACPQ